MSKEFEKGYKEGYADAKFHFISEFVKDLEKHDGLHGCPANEQIKKYEEMLK